MEADHHHHHHHPHHHPHQESNNIDNMDLKHADSDSVNSIPPPPPPMGMVVPVASEESMDITEAERLKQQQEMDQEEYEMQQQQQQQQLQHQQLEQQKLHESQLNQSTDEKTPVLKEDNDGRSDNCCEKILKCMSVVPCGSLLSWIVQLLGIGCLTGGLLIATRRSRDLLDEDCFLWFMEYTLIGVSVGMFVLTTLFLVCGHLSSEPTSRRVFNSFRKNKCAKGLNISVLVFTYILTALWILATCLLGTPLVFILNFLIVDRDSFNTDVFGFQSKEYKDQALDDFTEDVEKLLICYGVAMFGAFLITNSLIFFIMSISANIKHLQDNRFATLNAYDGEEVRNSKHSVVDTNM